MTEAFPLAWPIARPRSRRPESSRFKTTFGKARDGLVDELRRMGATGVILSTNIPVRLDGLPYAKFREPDDSGVAVYFERKGRTLAFSCDRWNSVRDNIQAIRLSIEALRGLDRWGTGDMVEAAFTGFQALPPPDWRGDLGLDRDSTIDQAERAYRTRARAAHPDAGGSDAAMSRLNHAIERAREALSP